MRTTLTLDDDVGERLRDAAHRERKPFRTVVNEALRLGLGLRDKAARSPRTFHVQTFHSPFRAGVDEARLNQLADQMEADDFVGETVPPAAGRLAAEGGRTGSA